MAIVEQKDPRTKKTFLEASGVIQAVYLNELKNPKTYPGTKGQSWTPTHSVALVVDGDKISLGLFEKTDKRPAPSAKDADDNYHALAIGAEVSVVITRGEDYNDKPQYSAFSSDVLILTPAPVQTAATAGGSAPAPYQKKDMTGVKVGHAINVALNVVGLAEAEEIIAAAKEANDLTEKLRAEYKEKNPSMSEYDLGASVGQAVLSASSYVDTVAEIEAYARQTLDVIAPAVTEYIKGQSEPKKTVAAKTVAKKTTKPKATPAKPVVEDDSSGIGFDDMDDDIPF
ncbi:hypothetical protein D3C87_323450 [compost metagenome]